MEDGTNMAETVSQKDIKAFSEIKKNFLEKIYSMTKEDANNYITAMLIDAGILDEDGKEKEQIVTGDFFGW